MPPLRGSLPPAVCLLPTSSLSLSVRRLRVSVWARVSCPNTFKDGETDEVLNARTALAIALDSLRFGGRAVAGARRGRAAADGGDRGGRGGVLRLALRDALHARPAA